MATKSSRSRQSSRRRPLDVSNWQPKLHPSETLDRAFFRRCHQIEREIVNRVEYEREFNENNFDSGWTVEEIVRQALIELLPTRSALLLLATAEASQRAISTLPSIMTPGSPQSNLGQPQNLARCIYQSKECMPF